ncbi:GDSL-type esterase/lipase family protein [Heliorestis convoluta]|uniref:GDSL-like Lipase/Acylhydrolase family protein n=1 Tax=Heliorestis convoluta TaxID=356322 RepID=A0A5Q2MWM0_9FIRM|nr:GDSL-type esterase/lipase family protein [Heliorestis convoluta]QGG46737.1 GDSL-like Lipase/Acylhydrolase family protein [Heliorestis convoluta]
MVIEKGPQSIAQKPSTIYAVGDSLTWGYPYGPEASWTTSVEGAFYIPVANLGLNGATTEDMRRILISHLPDLEPRSWVIITGGANDAYGMISPRKVIQNYRDMIERIEVARCVPIIGLTTAISEEPARTRVIEYRALLLDFLKGRKEEGAGSLRTIDFFKPLLAADGCSLAPQYAADDCHPNRHGYEKMGEVAVHMIGTYLEEIRITDHNRS